MHPFPHQYRVAARAEPGGDVSVTAKDLPALATNAPIEFDGPGGRWSPEALLTAAVADCFVLSFRAIARASKLAWNGLEVEAEGTLDRIEGVSRFTRFEVTARLKVPPGTDSARAQKLLEKAEAICLITNSLSGERHVNATVLEE
jgi:organic hydroperoxide reductase OsmC/OhrA